MGLLIPVGSLAFQRITKTAHFPWPQHGHFSVLILPDHSCSKDEIYNGCDTS